MNGGMGNKLVFSRNLRIVACFQLTIFHMVVFHAHESSVRVGLAVRVPISHLVQMLLVGLQLRQMLLLQCLE